MAKGIIVLLAVLAIVSIAIFIGSLVWYFNNRNKRKHERELTEKQQRHKETMEREKRDYETIIEDIENKD